MYDNVGALSINITIIVDEESLPTLKMLQDGLLNETEDDVEDMLSLISHLLRYALEDPGVPNPKEVRHISS